MIVEIIFYMVSSLLNLTGYLFGWDGQAITQLPWGLDNAVVTGVSGYKTLATIFPPFNTVLTAFLIYFSFRIGIRLLKAIPLFGRMLERS